VGVDAPAPVTVSGVPSDAGVALGDGARLRGAVAAAAGVVVFDASSPPPPQAVAATERATAAQSSRRADRLMGIHAFRMNAVQSDVTINQIGAEVKGRRLLRI
jgi:hypothetical protein